MFLIVFVCVRLFQVKMEKEQYQTEIRDLQDQLSEMHDELDGAKQYQTDSGEKEAIMKVHHYNYTKHITFICPADKTCLISMNFHAG